MRRPSPIAWWMPGGRSADAKRCATRTNFCVASSSSKTSLSVSAVSPDGPGAAAFRARRKLVRRRSAGMSTGSGGSYWSSAGSSAWYGACGRRLGSVSSSNVLRSPGAKGPAVRAWRAADNSPWCTSCLARCAFGFGLVLLVSAVIMGWEAFALDRSVNHCPA